MSTIQHRVRILLAGTVLTLAVTAPALADDTEIYQSQAAATGARPNVLFIIDTSGSMDSEVEQSVPAYDPSFTYTGSCSNTYIYFSQNDDKVPTCGTTQRFQRSANKCDASAAALVNIGGAGSWPALGNARARVAQYRQGGTNNYWNWYTIRNETSPVECLADEGIHGETAASDKKWIMDGNSATTGWDSKSHSEWNNVNSDTYRFYTANYMNYKNGTGAPTTQTRLQIVRDVAINLASSLNDVNLGLMRYSSDAQGGYVLEPVKNIADNRTAIIDQLKKFDPKDGAGYTPLSETYYEAARYLKGDTWDYGSKSSPATSAAGSVTADGKYISPIEYSCQKSYIVYLTDGAPTKDDDANSKIATMVGKGACAVDASPPFQDNGYTSGSGLCMDDLAAYLSSSDTDLMPGTIVNGKDVSGNQNALTYMIGFGSSLAASVPYLNMVAAAGGTKKAYTAADVPTLTTALQTIFSDIQEDSATFVTPSIAVNAFNRAQTENDLFFSLFKAGKRTHWAGNLKKYKLKDNAIVDANDNAAVAATGFFSTTSTSIWSPAQDGADITAGGAASQLPAPDSRKIYTSLAGSDLTASGNAVTISNSNITDLVVGTGATATACSSSTACQAAVNWARGKDVDDNDGDKDFDEQVQFMGDPLHGRPAVVTYGKTGSESDTVVFFPTNDGFLHAIQGTTSPSGSGKEMWAYIPPELLTRLGALRSNAQNLTRSYGLDGDIRVLRLDKNQNGVVDSGDRVWLFFGMRAGGNHYYALDVTDRSKPTLMWNIGPNELPGIGQTWSPPVVTRVNVTGSSANTDDEKFVLIFGGGYDSTQETQSYATDTRGNRIYMVEAKSGKLMWYAGGTNTGSTGTPDLALDSSTAKQMNNSIPGRITVVDTNGDQFADRMYAADMGGRIWRFDIFNGQARDKLVTGGVLATLGAAHMGTPTDADNRRFYNAPDVALIQFRGQDPYYNIAIGSGYRGHPLNVTTQERFYSVRDGLPYAMLTQDQYNAITPTTDSDLVDITSDPAGSTVTKASKGWRLSMSAAGSFKGEKVLSESVTVNNVILFTSFEPIQLGSTLGPCYPSSINRAYAVTAFAGKPALDFNDDKKTDNSDLYTNLNQEGIVGDINVALQRSDENAPPTEPPTVCLAGLEVLKKCVSVGGTIRTFWDRSDVK